MTGSVAEGTSAALEKLADSRHRMVAEALQVLDGGIVKELIDRTTTQRQFTAVGRQLVIGAERLIRGNATLVAVQSALRKALQHLKPVGRDLICTAVDDRADALPDLLSPGCRAVPAHVEALLAQADVGISASEFAERAGQHAPLVLTLRAITLRDVARSWANTRLYGSVYLDVLDDPNLVARDIVHEATHCWLNDLLVASRVRLDTMTDRYWSPWKQIRRPEFGFVHSIASFSAVVVFLDSVASALPQHSSERRRLHILADAERSRLLSCRSDVLALHLPPNLKVLLVPTYERAILVG